MSLAHLGLRSWRIRDPGRPAIYRVAAGSAINSIGSGATNVAFGFFLYDRTGSAVWLSVWFFFSFGVTGVLTPVAGWLADRFDRRRIIVVSNVGAATCSLALIVMHDPVALVSVAFVNAIIGRAGGPRVPSGAAEHDRRRVARVGERHAERRLPHR
jgi:MFS family permease